MDAVGQGQLVLARLQHGRDQLRQYGIDVDGQKIGSIAAGRVETFTLPVGRHELVLRIDWCTSPIATFDLNTATPTAELWCCAGSSAHLDDIIVRRHRYVQLGARSDADAMPAKAAFDTGHFIKLIVAIVVIAILVGVLIALL